MEQKGDRSRRHSTHSLPINPKLRKKKKYKKKEKNITISLVQHNSTEGERVNVYNSLCQGVDLRVCNSFIEEDK